jgi:hypothetical protein
VKRLAIAAIASFVLAPSVVLALTDADCIRIREARDIAFGPGAELWPGWEDAPFAILLVAEDVEYLIYHPRPGTTFIDTGRDERLGTNVFRRKRVLDDRLQATFPIDGVPTIVIGRPERTDAGHTTRWVLTLLHEHFHQWQQSQPDYYTDAHALGLANRDSTGMWMLNYPFPYDNPDLNDVFAEMCDRLREAVVTGTEAKRQAFFEARGELQNSLEPRDYRYLSFQLWQEGVARYTELILAQRVSASYSPREDFTQLTDYRPFRDVGIEMKVNMSAQLATMSLIESRRKAFYYVGAAEALLLDRHNPAWRDLYFKKKFFLEKYYNPSG